MPATTPFFDFARPYGFDPAIGNSMHFIFLPIEIKVLALAAAIAAYLIVRKKLSRQSHVTAATTTAIISALVAASLIISLRSDMNMADFLISAHHNYSARQGDEKLSLIDDNMAIYAKAKQYINAGYSLITPPEDLLIPRLNAQYILAPILPEDASTAPYIIVTDPLSKYDKATHTLRTRDFTITNIGQIFAHNENAKGLYSKNIQTKQ